MTAVIPSRRVEPYAHDMADHDRELAASVLRPRHPERTCWGCDLYCPAKDLRCGNGTIRTPHPIELFGDDWQPDGPLDDILSDCDVRGASDREEPAAKPV